jgi:hypothetical protein
VAGRLPGIIVRRASGFEAIFCAVKQAPDILVMA